MQAPGQLDELDRPGAEAWDERVAATLREVLRELEEGGRPAQGLTTDTTAVPDVRAPDWPGFPARIGSCLGRRPALELLDWRVEGRGDMGRFRHQEEYLEWRVTRRPEDAETIARIEMTTELREYWEVLAAYQPDVLLAVVAEFAGRDDVEAREVYGEVDPDTSDQAERLRAFRRTMLPPAGAVSLATVSPLNDGTDAICCMVQPTNTLKALLALAASAARPMLVRDELTGRPRFASGAEAIEALAAAAQDGRQSDPLVVERVTSLVTEGRAVGFDDPIGVYIRSVQHHALVQPDGADVPQEWFSFSRGLSTTAASDGRQRAQRLTLAVPDDADFALSDLVVRRTGKRLAFGGQLAALVQLTVYLRSGRPEGVSSQPLEVTLVPEPACADAEASLCEMAGS